MISGNNYLMMNLHIPYDSSTQIFTELQLLKLPNNHTTTNNNHIVDAL